MFSVLVLIERLNKHTQIVARVAFHSSLARPAAVQRAGASAMGAMAASIAAAPLLICLTHPNILCGSAKCENAFVLNSCGYRCAPGG